MKQQRCHIYQINAAVKVIEISGIALRWTMGRGVHLSKSGQLAKRLASGSGMLAFTASPSASGLKILTLKTGHRRNRNAPNPAYLAIKSGDFTQGPRSDRSSSSSYRCRERVELPRRRP